jgi:CHAT domain-containing protein/tetratricopeptide (TPR) repeat protein
MKKLFLYGLFFLLAFGAGAQDVNDHMLKKSGWRRAAVRFTRQRNASAVISDLNNLINSANANGKKDVAIYYEMLLGEQYEKINDFVSAESVFIKAYEEAKVNRPAKGHKYYLFRQQYQKTYFDPIDRLGYFYLTIGNLKRSAQLFEESAVLRNSYFPRHSVHRVHPVVGMGSYYFKKRQVARTYEQFNKAQAMMARATTTGYDFDNLNRLFLSDLIELCFILGKQDEALVYINRLAIASSGFGKFSSAVAARSEVARVFELKARYYLGAGNFEKAQEYIDKANHYNPENLSASKVKLKLLKTQALLFWYQNQLENASQAFQKMIEEYRLHIQRNFSSMSDYEREQFYYTLKNDIDLFNSFVIENPGLASATLYGEMYNNTLNTKALLLNETNRLKNQILKSGNTELINKLSQWENAKDELAALYFEKNTPSQIDSLEKSIENLERSINQSSALFKTKDAEVSWQAVKGTLAEGDVAVELVRVNHFDRTHPMRSAIRNGLTDSAVYVALVVSPRSVQPECFQLKGNRLETHFLPYYRNSILAKTDDKFSYDNFWRPLKSHLGTVKKIYLSADGVYNQINLNTLRNTVTNNYLIDEVELVAVTNTADLLKNKTETKNNEAVLIGRPAYQFSGKSVSELVANAAAVPKGLRSLSSEELISLKDQNFADLPGTAEEVTQIASELTRQSMHVNVYVGEEALEENVKALKRPELLHIATHGFFVDDTASSVSPMIRSGIILAGVRNPESKSKEDGVLTAYEATNLDLEGTDLVVLSACETGLGEVRNGEGVYGLQRSIMVAGARNLLMSLWKVDDEATAQLMSVFYRLRVNQSNSAAFREAQIQLRKNFPEPFYWGAFVLLGK